MIQDIFPHKWSNTYRNAQPQQDSGILFFKDGKVLVVHPEGEKHKIVFPEYRAVRTYCKELIYLFSLDDRMYFRCSSQQEELAEMLSGTWENRNYFRKAQPKELAFVGITAMHLDGWYRKSIFCGSCGEQLVHDSKERMMRCLSCGNMIFPRINPAVIVGVCKGNKILLTKYRGREYKNYALVAGFNEIGESFEQTVEREVMEETGISVKNIHYYKSQPWGFADNILAGYFCEADGETAIKMDDEELSVAEWVSAEDIPEDMEPLSLTNEMIQKFRVDNLRK